MGRLVSQQVSNHVQIEEHGGRLARMRSEYPDFSGDWLDLSSGISPWSYPVPTWHETKLRALPDEDLLAQACSTAAAHYGVAENTIISASGAQAFINLLVLVATDYLGVKPVVYTLSPTYSEYAACARRFGCEARQVQVGDAWPQENIVILANPNNPDGRMPSAEQARACCESLGKQGLLVIDEAFCDVSPQDSLVGLLDQCENLLILKSFGKFFGLAGLRLGFCLGAPRLLQLFTAYLGAWPVSAPALMTAAHAYADKTWIASQRSRIIDNAAVLCTLLETLPDTEIVTNCGLFITLKSHLPLFETCAQHGIYIRQFTSLPHPPRLYRFGLPTVSSLPRLRQALSDF